MKRSDKKFHTRIWFLGILGILIFIAAGFGLYSIWRQYQLERAILPAFPGAEGFGAVTEGGRFGRIVFVTNLSDTTNVNSPDYPGSLRWAVDHTWKMDPLNPYGGRRVVIFRVGGAINLVDRLIVRNPYITIAGQTAPGDGILLKGDEFTIATHDVIVRGIRVRVGDEGAPTCCRDGINIGTFYSTSDVYNVIVDHSSVSWAVDENFSVWTDLTDGYTVHDITVQWNIVSQGLNNSIHVDEGAVDGVTDPHSMGLIIGNNGKNITIHHNLFALNWGRNPRVEGVDGVEILNNVMYGWVNEAIEFGGTTPTRTHIIGNYFKPTDSSSADEIMVSKQLPLLSLIYPFDNFVDDPRSVPATKNIHISLPANFLLASKAVFKESGVAVEPSQAVYQTVLSYAGAVTPARDQIDRWVVEDVIHGTGSIIDSQNEVGGWPVMVGAPYPQDTDGDGIPDAWEVAQGCDPNDPYDASSYTIRAPSGYTWIEEYVNSLLLVHP
jgi:pectate lyase